MQNYYRVKNNYEKVIEKHWRGIDEILDKLSVQYKRRDSLARFSNSKGVSRDIDFVLDDMDSTIKSLERKIRERLEVLDSFEALSKHSDTRFLEGKE